MNASVVVIRDRPRRHFRRRPTWMITCFWMMILVCCSFLMLMLLFPDATSTSQSVFFPSYCNDNFQLMLSQECDLFFTVTVFLLSYIPAVSNYYLHFSILILEHLRQNYRLKKIIIKKKSSVDVTFTFCSGRKQYYQMRSEPLCSHFCCIRGKQRTTRDATIL